MITLQAFSGRLETIGFPNALDSEPMFVSVIGESCLRTTSIAEIGLPLGVIVTLTFTLSPGLAVWLPKSKMISPSVGCSEGCLVVVVVTLLVVDVTVASPTVIKPLTLDTL